MKILIAVLPLLAGFLLDCILGDPYSLPHPIRLIGRLISALEKWARNAFANHLTAGGTILALIVLLTSAGIPLAVLFLCYRVNIWLGAAAESILCYYMLAARCLRSESMKAYRAISENDTEKARTAVSMIVGRDTKPLDRNGITARRLKPLRKTPPTESPPPCCTWDLAAPCWDSSTRRRTRWIP